MGTRGPVNNLYVNRNNLYGSPMVRHAGSIGGYIGAHVNPLADNVAKRLTLAVWDRAVCPLMTWAKRAHSSGLLSPRVLSFSFRVDKLAVAPLASP